MRVYLLEFDRPETLSRAFELVLESGRVRSCSAESGSRRLRFVAAPRPGDRLLERIYLDGGLTWCSRHEPVPTSCTPDPPPGKRLRRSPPPRAGG
ncbi:MAG: hypothetical protein ABFS46_05045 [Myxococcota bacterium]